MATVTVQDCPARDLVDELKELAGEALKRGEPDVAKKAMAKIDALQKARARLQADGAAATSGPWEKYQGCITIGESNPRTYLTIPPGQARDFEASVYFPDEGPNPKGRLEWDYSVKEVKAE